MEFNREPYPTRCLWFKFKVTADFTLEFYQHHQVVRLVEQALGLDHSIWSVLADVITPFQTVNCHYKRGQIYSVLLLFTGKLQTHHTDAFHQILQVFNSNHQEQNHTIPLLPEKLHCYLSGAPVMGLETLRIYSKRQFTADIKFWNKQEDIVLRFYSPTLLFKGKHNDLNLENKGVNLDLIRNRYELTADALLYQLGLNDLIDSPYQPIQIKQDHLFWSDNGNTKGHGVNLQGGLFGSLRIHLSNNTHIKTRIIKALSSAQILGLGSNTNIGMGRFQLQTIDHRSRWAYRSPSPSIFDSLLIEKNLNQAHLQLLQKHPELAATTEVQKFDAAGIIRTLKHGGYKASQLNPYHLILEGKKPRDLLIPSIEDRILQRTVHNLLAPNLDRLSMAYSFGYRSGHSRMQARDTILKLQSRGYVWVLECDILGFFEHVEFSEIENRLRSLLFNDAIVDLIMQWVSAPVKANWTPHSNAKQIQRQSGLPQGASISPILANLLLEPLDAELQYNNYEVIRYADDFIVLCKTKAKAEQASKLITNSLADMRLEVNADKTRVVSPDSDFQFLGYVFRNGMACEVTKHKKPNSVGSTSQFINPENNRFPKNNSQEKNQSKEMTDAFELNYGSTVFVTPPTKLIRQKGGVLQIASKEPTQQNMLSLPWSNISSIICFGRQELSHQVIKSAFQHKAIIYFCSSAGRYLGELSSALTDTSNYKRWQQQTACFSITDTQLQLAQNLVKAKLTNQLLLLQSKQRHKANTFEQISQIKTCLVKINKTISLDSLRGIEGKAAQQYFKCLRLWLNDEFGFNQRQQKNADDPVNTALSLGYSILHRYAETSIRIVGLNPINGFYHVSQGAHQALASDIIEPFRSSIDRCVLSLFNRNQIQHDCFENSNNEKRFNSETLKLCLNAFNTVVLKTYNNEQGQQSSIFKDMIDISHQLRELIHKNRDTSEVQFSRKL